MAHYIALIHKENDSCYGVSFPDVPGTITAGDTIDEAMEKAKEVLAFAFEFWHADTGTTFPKPRSIDELRDDVVFQNMAKDALLAVISLQGHDFMQAAE